MSNISREFGSIKIAHTAVIAPKPSTTPAEHWAELDREMPLIELIEAPALQHGP